MENPAMRKSFGMADGQKGVVIRRVAATAAAQGTVKENDVLLGFDGHSIGVDGTVPFRKGERVGFSYLVSRKFIGDTASLDVLRDGVRTALSLAMDKPAPLVPPHLNDTTGLPPYVGEDVAAAAVAATSTTSTTTPGPATAVIAHTTPARLLLLLLLLLLTN
jgi:hypothetical protein